MSNRRHVQLGLLLIASGLFHLGVLLTAGSGWEGPLSWRKPTTFGLSFGITLITIAWVASYLPLRRRWPLTAFAVACGAEVGLITLQAWRRVPSHFNMSTSFDSAVARILAAGGAVLVAVIVWLTVVSWRPLAGVGASMRLALRAGLLALDSALAVGVIMIVIGVRDVTAGNQDAAYTVGATWKPAHFVPMHGVLALPLLAWLLARCDLSERARTRIVALAAAGYAMLCALAVTGSALDTDPMHAASLYYVIAAVGTAAITAAAALTATRMLQPLRTSGAGPPRPEAPAPDLATSHRSQPNPS